MKYGYTRQCGWHLNRGDLTRHQYAAKKRLHAFEDKGSPREVETIITEEIETHLPGCLFLRKELEKSHKVSLAAK